MYAYLEGASLKDYYVASVAEQVFLHPAGSLETYGLSSTSIYLKGAMDKVGVAAEVIKIDEYKSAGERFDRTGPSEPDKAQRQELQRDAYAQIVHDIAQARGLTLAESASASTRHPGARTRRWTPAWWTTWSSATSCSTGSRSG